MGKHLPFSGQCKVELGEHQPGCFWGMLHVLDYHHWQYMKRLLHHKKHHMRRKRCVNPKTISFTYDAGKAPEHNDAESEHLPGQHHIEGGETLVATDISNEEVDKKHDHLIGGEMGRTTPCSTKAEDELFQRILHNSHFGIVKDVATEYDANRDPRFTKARSFPVPSSSGVQSYKASTLKHKQNEVWFFPGGDGREIGSSNFPKDHKIRLKPFNGIFKQETTFSSLDSPKTVHSHGWNHLIISQFKGIKRRIKRALKENRKGDSPTEAIIDHGSSTDDKNENSNDRVEESKLQGMLRLSSLNDSLDKYARLFEESVSLESKATKLNNSKSLKLTTEDRTSAPKTFRRRLSLPDHETLGALLGDLSYDHLYSGLPTKTKTESNKSKELKLKSEPLGSSHDFPKIDPMEKSSEGRDANLITEPGQSSVGDGTEDRFGDDDICDENSVESVKRKNILIHGEEIGMSLKDAAEAEPSSPVSVLHSFLSHWKTGVAPFSFLEGMELHPLGALDDGNIGTRNEAAGNLLQTRPIIVEEDVTDFNFVKDILKLGGFFQNEFIEPWESMDLPLNPKLFDDSEVSKLHGIECSDGQCGHQVLFDLTNEALLEICERHFTYFPRAFSLGRFTRPVTKGQHLLEDVWTRVKWYRSMGPELDTTLDDIVGQDMAKGDRWMDLEWESQCRALELEDMIFDELVNELIRS
ncbi:protein TRM32-like isoform X2 [Punica granatum]|uniref:Protein TRM32-like isoform X2 n=1 Tax=Punica granatum TaxID=22663 RepID=A0A6P8DUE9_PUNGR|nr:protein TRM32-like isoform X2 [Punica granatum]